MDRSWIYKWNLCKLYKYSGYKQADQEKSEGRNYYFKPEKAINKNMV